jgi:hypothetical protein
VMPFLVERTVLFDAGVCMKGVREEGVRRFGLMRIDPRVRGEWLKWMVWRGYKPGDFPIGKVPVDFTDGLCHTMCLDGGTT